VGLRHNSGGSFDALTTTPSSGSRSTPRAARVEHRDATGSPTSPSVTCTLDHGLRPASTPDSLEGIAAYDGRDQVRLRLAGARKVFRPGKSAGYFESFLWLHDYNAIPRMFTRDLACSPATNCSPDLEAGSTYYSSTCSDRVANQGSRTATRPCGAEAAGVRSLALENSNRYFNTYLRARSPCHADELQRRHAYCASDRGTFASRS